MSVIAGKRKTRAQEALAAAEPVRSRILEADSVRKVTIKLHRGGIVMFAIAVDTQAVSRWIEKLDRFSERGRDDATRQHRIDKAVEVLELPAGHGLSAREHDVILMVAI